MAVHEYPQSHGSLAGLSDTDHHKQYGLMLPPGTAAARPGAPWRLGRWYYATDTGVVSYDNGGGWVDLPRGDHAHPQRPRVRVPHTFTISGEVKVASGDDFYVPPFFVSVPAGQTVRVVGARHRIRSGTSATVNLFVEAPDGMSDVALFGFGGLAVTPTRTTTALDAAVLNNESLVLEVTAVSGAPKNLSFTVFLQYTGVMI